MHAVALVVVHLRDRRVDRDLVEVRPAQPRDLRVDVGVDAAGQQRIVGEVDARHDVRGAERHLLGLGEEVVGVAVEHHAADRRHRHQLLGNDLGGVEHVEAELLGLLLGEDLQAQLPLGILARLDRFPQVAAVEVGVGAGDLHRLVPHQRVRAQHAASSGTCTNTDSPCVVDQAEGVHAEALHHAVAARDGAVGHHPHQHVRRLGHQRDEVPERVVRRRRLRHARGAARASPHGRGRGTSSRPG